jgi:hypothetical protein
MVALQNYHLYNIQSRKQFSHERTEDLIQNKLVADNGATYAKPFA